MAKLRELAPAIRSKNAGPFWLTFDCMFRDPSVYRAAKATGALTPKVFAELFRVAESEMVFLWYDAANALKVSIPRPVVAGSPGDGDLYGCQWFSLIVDLEIPVNLPPPD